MPRMLGVVPGRLDKAMKITKVRNRKLFDAVCAVLHKHGLLEGLDREELYQLVLDLKRVIDE